MQRLSFESKPTDFYDDKLIVETSKKPDAVDNPMLGDKLTHSKMEDELFLFLAKEGALRIRDLLVFKETGQTFSPPSATTASNGSCSGPDYQAL